MQMTLGHTLAYWGFIGIFAQCVWMPFAWLLMHFLTPKALMRHYFKLPHFSQGELIAFSGFPFMFLRTGIFMWVCIAPWQAKKRQMTDIRRYAPRWYVISSMLFMGLTFLSLFLCFGAIMLI